MPSDRVPPVYLAGLLDGAGTIYPNALVVRCRDEGVKAALKRNTGGSVESSRWVLKSERKRRAIYEAWAEHTRYRRAEIEAALDSLGSA